MIGNSIKGLIFLAVIGLSLIGVATLLPESAWEKMPERLHPVRAFLAEHQIIAAKFAPNAGGNGEGNAGGNAELSAAAGENFGAAPFANACPGGVCPLPPLDERERSFPQEQPILFADRTDPLPPPSLPRTPTLTPTPSPILSPIPTPTFPETSSENPPLPNADLSREAPRDPSREPARLPLPTEPSLTADTPFASGSPVDTLPELQFGEGKGGTLTPDPASAPFGSESPLQAEPVTQPPQTSQQTSPQIPPLPVLPSAGPPSFELQSAERHQNAPQSEPQSEYQSAQQNEASNLGASVPLDFTVTPSAPQESAQNSGQPLLSLSDELTDAIQAAQRPDQSAEAFLRLNELYHRSVNELSQADRDRLHRELDRLAFDMFYNPKRHLLEAEYAVGANQTLAHIAAEYQVSPEFLAAINGLTTPIDQPLAVGTRLKVVRGPVAAEVSFSRMELLLTFNGLYAGRFRMGCPERAKAVRGDFAVTRKILNPEYTGPLSDGQMGHLGGGDPANPLGSCWIELTGGLGLQGTNRPEWIGSTAAPQGGLIFSNRDIEHLNILLVAGSTLRIVQ